MKTANSDLNFYSASLQQWDKYFSGQQSIAVGQLQPLLAEMNRSVRAYHRKKLAFYHYDQSWSQLSDAQRARVETVLAKQLDIENALIRSSEAQLVLIERQLIHQAYAYIFTDSQAADFQCWDEFKQLLYADQLDPNRVFLSLLQQTAIEQLMAYVAKQMQPISRQDGYQYYLQHPDQFTQPEYRTVSHILITINEQLAENSYQKSLQRATLIAAQLSQAPQQFAQLAAQYSECPTALNAGFLGKVKRGTLYPELDAQLFSMQQGEISQCVQSEIGFHILYCQAIEAEKLLSFDCIAEALLLQLTAQAAKRKQQQWLRDTMNLASTSVQRGDAAPTEHQIQ